MKRILTVFILILIASSAFSQNITNKQFALIHYELNISDEFRKDLKPIKRFIKNAEVHNKDADDKLKAILIHHMYYHLKDRFQDELDIHIIPINTFVNEVKYNEFGYPKTNISKALRIGSTPFYFKVKIHLESLTKERKKNDPELKGDIYFPHIITEVTIYNDDGILPVEKWRGEKITYNPYDVNERIFRGFIDEDQLPAQPSLEEGQTEQASLYQMYDETLEQMISSFLGD